jgi:hypothetical protein
MTLLSRVSVVGSRTTLSARNQLTRFKVVENTKSSFGRNLSTSAANNGSSSGPSKFAAIGNVILGTTLVGAGVGSVVFTYLRFKNSGFGMGVAANTIMDDGLHPAAHPWPNHHPFATYDHARYDILTSGNQLT